MSADDASPGQPSPAQGDSPAQGGSPAPPASPPGSHVGSLCDGLPAYVSDPPIETVVFAWGVNEDGQLGLERAPRPVPIGADNILAPKVVEACLGTRFRGREFGCSPLVASSRNTLAIDADGNIITWGWNARGTLGHGHREPMGKPQRVMGLHGVHIKQAALGGWHVLAVDDSGQCWAWGGNEYGQCLPRDKRDILAPVKCLEGIRVKQVAAGGMHSLALTDSGEIWMWGEPWGDFSMDIDRSPRRVDSTSDFADISCGAFHNLALNAAGECFTWGINDFGMLGNGTTSYATCPEKVVGLEAVHIADVSAGGWHSMAISTEGEVYVWGRGEYGRLGLGDRTGSSKLRPQKVKALEGHRVVEGSCGGTHTMVVTDEGRCFLWGRGAFGRLGTGAAQKDLPSPVELKLPGGPERWRVISAAAGGRHSMVLALPDNGNLGQRQAEWSLRKPLYSPSPPPSIMGRERSWGHVADDEQTEREDGGVSPEGASDYADDGIDGRSPQEPAHRAFSSQHLQQLELSAAMEGNRPSDSLGSDMGELSLEASPAHMAAAAAAARVQGLRDDGPGN